jgi:hypothetical protein
MPSSPTELMSSILNPLSALFATGDAALQADILLCLRGIMRRYAAYDWRAFYTAQTQPAAFVLCSPFNSMTLF